MRGLSPSIMLIWSNLALCIAREWNRGCAGDSVLASGVDWSAKCFVLSDVSFRADSVVVPVLSETKALRVRVCSGAVGACLERAGGRGSRSVRTVALCGGAVEARGGAYGSSGGAQCRRSGVRVRDAFRVQDPPGRSLPDWPHCPTPGTTWGRTAAHRGVFAAAAAR